MNKRTRQLLYTISGIIFSMSVAGMIFYGYQTFFIDPEIVESKDYKYHFALLAEEKDNDYWQLIQEGARNAAEENEVYLEFVAPEKVDNDDLLKLFDRFISAKVDGIIIPGIAGDRFIDLVHKASERRIPIMTIDTDVKNSERKAFVGPDNYAIGKLIGKEMMKQTIGERHVGILLGQLNSISQQERLAGFKEAIKDTPRIQIVDQRESNITTIGATQATYSLLKQHSSINTIIGFSELDGAGIVEGIQEIAPYKDVYIATVGPLQETLKLIQKKRIAATVSHDPKAMGFQAVEIMLKLQDGVFLPSTIYSDVKIITKWNLDRNEVQLK